MTFDGISRRQLLAGLTGVGAAGALTGLGTGALLSDTEGLAAGLAGGALDLEVTWAYPGPSGASDSDASLARVPTTEAGTESTVSITVDLPQGETDFNNAAFVWVRLRCPEESEVPADDVRVELSYADGDLDGQSVLGPATLADLLSQETGDGAQTGVLLRATEDSACLDTRDGGDPIRLALHIAVEEDYVGETAFHLPFEFVGHQCRHAMATENPFARDPVGPCGSVGTLQEQPAEPDDPKPTEEATTESESGETETPGESTTASESTETETPEEPTPDESTPEEPTPESESTETETETTTEQQSTTAQQPTDEQSTGTTGTPESTPDSADPSIGGGRA